jgi:hypothetical protein
MSINPLHKGAAAQEALPGNGTARDQMTVGPVAETHVFRPPLALTAQFGAMAGMLAGLWVAISPWFLTLQTPAAPNARVNDLIVGLAVAAIGMLALAGTRSVTGLETASLLAGIWMIISPFILDAKFTITGSMYWSNIWSGAVVIVLALTVLLAARPSAAR